MKWVKATTRRPERTSWYFIRRNMLKNSTTESVKEVFHFDALKDKRQIPGYWCEVFEWLDESTPPQQSVEALKEIAQFSDVGDDFLAVVRMKEIASKALANILPSPPASKEG